MAALPFFRWAARPCCARSFCDKPLTPLQQAALDYREDLRQRLENAEQNEHVESPLGPSNLTSVMEVVAEEKIKAAQRTGHFQGLKGEGKKLDESRPVGDILKNAGFLPPWLELRKSIEARIASAKRSKLSPTAVEELNADIKRMNLAAPGPMQLPPFKPR